MTKSLPRNSLPSKFNLPIIFLIILFVFLWGLVYLSLRHDKKFVLSNPGDVVASEQEINSIVQKYGPKAAWEAMKNSIAPSGSGHSLAHILGHLAYKEKGVEAFSICDDSWAYGCYHGLLEEMIQKEGDGAITRAEKGCSPLPNNGSGCIHGIGHGLISWYGYDLTKALAGCDKLNGVNQIYCQEGVFMENIQPSMPSSNFISEQEKDYNWPCDRLDSKYQIACYHYEPVSLISLLGVEKLDLVAKNCHKIADSVVLEECIMSIGSWVGQSSGSDVVKVLDLCHKLKDDGDFSKCIKYAANEFAFQRYADSASRKLCEYLSDKQKDDCLKTIDDTRKRYQIAS